jgi:hypothetical protein
MLSTRIVEHPLAERARQHQAESVGDSAEGRAQALAFVQSIQAEWDSLDPGELRGLLMALAAKVVITSKGTLEYEWREPSPLFLPRGRRTKGSSASRCPDRCRAPDASGGERPD